MNRCYRLVFNKATQVWQVVSEIAKSHSKSAAVVMLPVSMLLAANVWADVAVNALPTGGNVVAGQSNITQSGNQLNIQQTTQKSIINWNTYNIGTNATVNYVQPNASAISLNRVVGQDPSQILGKLTANGQVWLINSNGVLFGKGAQVNVGGLVASTLNIADDDFLNSNYHFTGNTGSVVNMGSIVANNGGYVAMLAPEVRNEGIVSALQGNASLVAGDAITLDFNGNGLINVQVDSANINTLVENKHLIKVGGGQVLMGTRVADGLITSVINNSGRIEANTMVSEGGIVRLTGAKTVINSGEISAISSGNKGGTVHLLGENVGMFSNSSVNVSGKTGGGTILVGGDYQGKNAAIQNANKTFISKDAQLIADATHSGDGGKVIVWANDIARYYGSISAKGGAISGNGGFVEVSGKRLLNFLGSVDLSAANGNGGNLLLDPANITISNGLDTNTAGFSAIPTVDLTEAFADDAGLSSIFNVTTSFLGISAGSTITLQATNNITVANAFNLATATGSANTSLVLQADNNLSVLAGATITASGTGTISLTADANNNNTGTLSLNAALVSATGGISLAAASLTGVAAGTVTTSGGLVSVNVSGASSIAGIVDGTGGFTKTGAGSLTLSGANTYTGATTINAGTLVADNNTALGTTAGGTTVASGATLAIQGGRTIADALNITGNGVAGTAGALRNVSGNNTYTGAIALGAGGAFINANAGLLTISGAGNITGAQALTVGGAGNTTISKVVATGAGTLTKAGAGTLILSGANTYTGTSTINAGTLRYGANNAISTGAVVVNNSGTYDLNNFSDTIGALTVNSGAVGGTVSTGTGTLTLGGNVTSTGGAGNALISGNLALGSANRTFTTTNAADGLTVSAVVSGARALTKAGAGTLTLSGANTYTLATTVSAGRLVASNANALGAVGGGTTVNNGATLNVNNVTLAESAITLNGNGVSGAGALTGTGSAVVSGTVNTATASLIGTTSIASSLTLNGVVTAAVNLGIVGAGDVTAVNAANNFTTVNINGARNVSLRDANAIVLGNGASNLTGNLSLQAAGAITQTAGLTVAGATTLNAGAANDITLNNVANNLNTVTVTNGRDVSLVDSNAMTVGTSSVRTITARTLSGDLTLGGNITASATTGTAITLASAANFLNPGNSTLSTGAGSRWLVHSTNPTLDTRGAALLSAYNFKQYNTAFGGTILGAGNGFIYTVAPSVTPTLTGSASKGYDGNTTAPIGSLALGSTGAIDGDSIVLAGLSSATYDNKNAGTGKTVSATGISLTSANNAGKAVFGYQLASTTATGAVGDITQRAITVTAATDTKIYDANTSSAALPTITAGSIVGGDSAVFSQTFDNKNAGTGKTLTAAGSITDGNSGNNYAVTYVDNNTGVIDQLAITGAITANDKTYDGNATASIASRSLTGAIFGDDVSYVGGTASFADKNAEIGKTVTATGLSLSGVDAGNYTVNSTDTDTADISKAILTLNALTDSKTYDGNTSSIVAVDVLGLVGGDSVTGLTQSFDVKNAGARTLTVDAGYVVNDGNGGDNYTLTVNNAIGTISTANLSITANNQSKTYGQTVNFVGNEFASTGLVGLETIGNVTLASAGAVNTANVAGSPYAITASAASGGTFDANNYAITYNDGTLTVNRAALNVTANNATKSQGSVNPAFSSTITGFVNGETNTVLIGMLNHDTPAVNTSPAGNYAIRPFGLSADNYSIAFIDGILNVTAPTNIGVFNSALTRPEQAFQNCSSNLGSNEAMITGLEPFGLENVTYKEATSQPSVGGSVANALVNPSCLKL